MALKSRTWPLSAIAGTHQDGKAVISMEHHAVISSLLSQLGIRGGNANSTKTSQCALQEAAPSCC
eukprot:scaffold181179_cov47-Prasinocladus_malaysianus.AAC.2